ncbi:hypothetical protein TIFTF001_027933 [Ficus carica]|uniref:Uncharacterized protein n=1 Tax=Ficus carica TaxID=3494 RepID=A0AA88DP06_FICCA|nr:hypothetical protein TIFTF001_027933 [Ficus carica]
MTVWGGHGRSIYKDLENIPKSDLHYHGGAAREVVVAGKLVTLGLMTVTITPPFVVQRLRWSHFLLDICSDSGISSFEVSPRAKLSEVAMRARRDLGSGGSHWVGVGEG